MSHRRTWGQQPPFSEIESIQDFVRLFHARRLEPAYSGWDVDVIYVLTVSWAKCILDDRYINDSEKIKRLKNLLAASSQVIE
ncbi:hypothetical protein M5X00_06285 [Paenibacillus alvei]|uniref:Uncharacterized protein n=1 Tax=Paenibacillus alvei TaxID=44250 RepID=A0ABT4H7N8_PAEAL|nr:hypothetical protein [Paenibacillus alvei]MCY9542669.1 hypothetical protein [Paenibacillus alvei]MCY9708727.1 hypothetical protein [Paenibacillus alvei]MCY9732269.1 hypothetical protein [Paenibacillus alvei]MCY9753864.1 hypothetical protein [Paenibacillus alvei]MCY9764996.1 hypothetical protein [Paenibacillus alvei]